MAFRIEITGLNTERVLFVQTFDRTPVVQWTNTSNPDKAKMFSEKEGESTVDVVRNACQEMEEKENVKVFKGIDLVEVVTLDSTTLQCFAVF